MSSATPTAPDDAAVTAQLAEIWQHVLAVPEIAADADLFEALGATSMHALRAIELVWQRLEVNMPAETLLEAPTIAGQARLIQQRTAEQASLLVPIRPTGPKRPFFLFHGAGGAVLEYHRLASRIQDRPVLAFQDPRLREPWVKHQSIEQLVDRYVATWRERQPVGPYLLGGASAGGALALEVALRLSAEEQRHTLLVMFDTINPEGDRPSLKHQILLAVGRAFYRTAATLQMRRLGAALRRRFARTPRLLFMLALRFSRDLEQLKRGTRLFLPPEVFSGRDPRTLGDAEFLEALKPLVPNDTLAPGASPWSNFARHLELISMEVAFQHYQPRAKFQGQVVMINLADTRHQVFWQRYVEAPIKTYTFPFQGNEVRNAHAGQLGSDANIELFFATLQEEIRAWEARTGG